MGTPETHWSQLWKRSLGWPLECAATPHRGKWSYGGWIVPAHLETGCRVHPTSLGSAVCRPMALPHAPSGIKCQVWGLGNLEVEQRVLF